MDSSFFKTQRFETSLRWDAGDGGVLSGDSSEPELEVGFAEALGGAEGVWSPEVMLVGAVETSVMLSFLDQARRAQVDVLSYHSHARATLGRGGHGLPAVTGVLVQPVIEVATEHEATAARQIFSSLPAKCPLTGALAVEPRIEARVEVPTESRPVL